VVERYTLPGEQSELYSPIGLRLIDDFTGNAPIEPIRVHLELGDGNGGWRATDIKALPTLSGILSYPGLERRADVVGKPPRRYRVKLKADFYRPFYRMIPAGPVIGLPYYRETADGIEFDAFPYNDANPPTDYSVNPPKEIKTQARDVKLAPADNYPFAAYCRVLRGKVVDSTEKPVVDVEVKRGNTERVLSGEQGTFALPLRWSPNGLAIPIDAIDHRTGRTGTINVTLPQALSRSQKIVLS
jgi:hypothetical protein